MYTTVAVVVVVVSVASSTLVRRHSLCLVPRMYIAVGVITGGTLVIWLLLMKNTLHASCIVEAITLHQCLTRRGEGGDRQTVREVVKCVSANRFTRSHLQWSSTFQECVLECIPVKRSGEWLSLANRGRGPQREYPLPLHTLKHELRECSSSSGITTLAHHLASTTGSVYPSPLNPSISSSSSSPLQHTQQLIVTKIHLNVVLSQVHKMKHLKQFPIKCKWPSTTCCFTLVSPSLLQWRMFFLSLIDLFFFSNHEFSLPSQSTVDEGTHSLQRFPHLPSPAFSVIMRVTINQHYHRSYQLNQLILLCIIGVLIAHLTHSFEAVISCALKQQAHCSRRQSAD